MTFFPYAAYFATLKMEAAGSSETLRGLSYITLSYLIYLPIHLLSIQPTTHLSIHPSIYLIYLII